MRYQVVPTALQKKIILERMLGLIAQFASSLLCNEIIKCSTCHGFGKKLESIIIIIFPNLKLFLFILSNIQCKADERYETFYQRIVAHLEDNLLTVASGSQHDGGSSNRG